MEREAVESSNIRSVGYDEGTQALEVEFSSGTVYRYTGVPMSVHMDLVTSESVGKYFNANVKSAYPFTRVEE